jgi:hypothetical protein
VRSCEIDSANATVSHRLWFGASIGQCRARILQSSDTEGNHDFVAGNKRRSELRGELFEISNFVRDVLRNDIHEALERDEPDGLRGTATAGLLFEFNAVVLGLELIGLDDCAINRDCLEFHNLRPVYKEGQEYDKRAACVSKATRCTPSNTVNQ